MKVANALQGIGSIYLDSAPVIYFAETNPHYIQVVDPIFALFDSGAISAIASVVTLAECLVTPLRLGQTRQVQIFLDLLIGGSGARFVTLGAPEAQAAAELRTRYNLRLPDALQVASAISAGCDALLTNDSNLRRVTELRVLFLDDLEA